MSELNREQIIKALECCICGIDCTECPYFDNDSCPQTLNENALALITSQEQRIKELTEENERLRADNEILKMPRATIFEIGDAFDRGHKKGKADTVREMQERLKGRMKRVLLGECAVLAVTEADIKQILNESLEDK